MTETPQQDRVHTENLRELHTLRRSVTDRKVAGVAGGLGRHLNVDPTIIRVLFVVLCFFGGAGFLLYGAAWLFVPEEGRSDAVINTSGTTRNAVLIGAAAIAALLLIGDTTGRFGFPWPVAVIALVVFVMLMNRDRSTHTGGRTNTGPTTTGPTTTGGPMDTGTTDTGPTDTGPTDTGTSDTQDLALQGSSALEPTTQYGATQYGATQYEGTQYGEPPAPPWAPPADQGYQPPPPRSDRGPLLFGVTLALIALALGLLGLYDVAGGHVVDAAYPALALTVIGVMLLVGAWFGRPGGLVALGIVATIALAGASVAEPRFHGDRNVVLTPASSVQVRSDYYVPAGSIRLDMSNVRDVAALDGRTIDMRANAGELVVVLPPGVDAHVDAEVAVAGAADIAGQTSDGTGLHMVRNLDGGAAAPEVNLNLDLVVGHIEVRQS
jgi:phage shock protein PspC (stress-responsive transcriptional regulator)